MGCFPRCIAARAVLCAILATIVVERAGLIAAEYKVATFESDITIPIGHPCMGGGIANAREIVDPLFAKGFVLLAHDQPIVVLSLDWCQLNNDAFDRFRAVI